jgi:hypothetical protein
MGRENAMTESQTEKDNEARRKWFKPILDDVVKEMIARKAIVGAAVEANPVWAIPHQILIAKVWGMGQKNRFIWTISGEGVITDHIAGSMAATPKDAARHFALKWQMDADRLRQLGDSKSPVANTDPHMGNYADKLIKDAESLYDLTEREEIWL